ncbi:MAG: 3-phosphoshikimate 1-carboxyvinyltransferase [archaeon GW2011_AR10]|uniref:3-phosphoshikimate 1-carboxyvinyltransferase n=1 Tax=Candidatus Iainarchaeum sp. TaxID=3101447 RepID=A0A7J4IVM1_9ARCH|nr:MAG: 3-phosphoshikimate 1-carboxyvinyltransferase [archaeon GW2011_AR10]HIH08824.1 3-phosphoshikimate 1-carboxyvinyltransferase [Candidatus Diapherotrites archaeon]
MQQGKVLEIFPVENLRAVVSAPPSKAITLRSLFISSLAGGKSKLENALFAEDQQFAVKALNSVGANISYKNGSYSVVGSGGLLKAPSKKIFVGNSGVTLRFLASLCSLAEGKTVIDGSEAMRRRPVGELAAALKRLGVKISVSGNGFPPIEVEGKTFRGGTTELDLSTSSQFLSSILLSAPYAESDVKVMVKGIKRSMPFVDLTLNVMKQFGVTPTKEEDVFSVSAGQEYNARRLSIEGDYANASYFMAAAAVTGGTVIVKNLKKNSVQGDKVILSILERMGCNVKRSSSEVEVRGASLQGIEADLNDAPDLVPTIAVAAAFADGKTVLRNISHLKFKETDRLKALEAELRKIGADARASKDSLEIVGGRKLMGAEIETYNDHRIAMAFSVAGLRLKGIKILGPGCVAKSFPAFFSEFSKFGG